ncbi:hypothetical protein AALA61_05375 [Oscillospiraceae bacterium 42-9]|jgi:capsule polysaccharide modification protein KpsS|uniref:hypothetical protein n=1 Tax=Pseudoflavonifractor sp. 524-17 TaxID=2304577 RepID=UPI00192A5F3A|nr:hypothetical protein [Pseudoflavonifractor sp. 524-17]
MQTQPKYQSEVTTVVMGERTITIKNLTPILPQKEREKRKREVEQKLFDVFSKYAGQRV